MKIRQIIILGLMILGLWRPGSVFAGYACVEGDPCENFRELDAPNGCEKGFGDWCETQYETNTVIVCDAECRYPVTDTGPWGPLTKCASGATSPGCPSAPATVGPGTCCVNDVSGCFLPGTIVNGSGGGKKIEDVRVGDRVDSFADNALTESAVSQIYKILLANLKQLGHN